MIKVREATAHDVIVAYEEAIDVFKGEADAFNQVMRLLTKGWLYTVYHSSGSILGVVGGTLPHTGVVTVVAIFTDHIHSHPVGLIRCMRRMVRRSMKDLGLHRMQFTGLASSTQLPRWAEALGFEAEGILRSYGTDKEDYVMYGRVI